MRREHESTQDAQVHSVTSANEAASIESRQRLRAYAIKMGLRVVFFVVGAIVAVTWNEWVGLILMGISAVLPWFAVMGANLIRPPEQVKGASFATSPDPEQLSADSSPTEPRYGESEHASSAPGGDTIEGELVEEDPEEDPDSEENT
ncbi:MAG: DUF3099 domain-containing protein [Galactobacter sp.]